MTDNVAVGPEWKCVFCQERSGSRVYASRGTRKTLGVYYCASLLEKEKLLSYSKHTVAVASASRCNQKKYNVVKVQSSRCEWRSKINYHLHFASLSSAAGSLPHAVCTHTHVPPDLRSNHELSPDKPHEEVERYLLNGHAQMPELGIPEKRGGWDYR
jgi:hypothetical protein